MQFLRQSLTGLLLLGLTLGLFAFAAQTVFSAIQDSIAEDAAPQERRERVFAVNTLLAEEQTIAPVLTAFGEIQSRRTLEIRAKTGGSVVMLSPDFVEGGNVQQDQVLLQIDPADAQSALDRARSDLMDAEAETREADRALILARDELSAARAQAELRQQAFQRQVDLEARGVGTAATVETAELAAAQARQSVLISRQAEAQAEARVDQASTRLSRAQITLAETERRLADTAITAGFSGVLSDVDLVAGEVVTANERLADLIDGDRLEVAFRISTAQYTRLLDAQGSLISAPVRIEMTGFELALEATGVITRDSAAVGEGQTGRLLFARLDSAAGLKPGDFVTVHVEEPALQQVIRLPATALGADGHVLVVAAEDRLAALPVTLVRRQGDDILIRAAALAGQQVVAERSPVLGAGIKVRVLAQRADTLQEASAVLDLNADRRADLIAFVKADPSLSEDRKTALIQQLEQGEVPAQIVERLETRMGG